MNEVHFLKMFPTKCRRPKGGGTTIIRRTYGQKRRTGKVVN